MKSGPLILQLRSDISTAYAPVCVNTLASHGFAVMSCASLAELTRQVCAVQNKPDPRTVAILDGHDAKTVPTVSTLRALDANLGIVALARPDDESAMIHLLHLGVDACCLSDASPDLLSAIVLRLFWRLGVVPKCSTPATPLTVPRDQTSGAWELIEQGWTLRSPNGHCITLTTGERAFLNVLLNSPSLQAAHADLIEAVNASYNTIEGHIHQSRLGVMVSRMRRKFRQEGVPLPLKSVHNWGYMFVVD